jgi:hypothetical protein
MAGDRTRSKVARPMVTIVSSIATKICRWGMIESYRPLVEGATIQRVSNGPTVITGYPALSHL